VLKHVSADLTLTCRNTTSCVYRRQPDKHARGNVIALRTANAESGIHISPQTTITKWCGEQMDDQMAVEGLLYRE